MDPGPTGLSVTIRLSRVVQNRDDDPYKPLLAAGPVETGHRKGQVIAVAV